MKSWHVLLVEDDKDHAVLTAGILREAGFEVTAVGDRRTALRIFEDGAVRVDLLITDVMMDYLSEGFDLAGQLRQDPATHELPIVILSGMRKVYDVEAEIGEGWYPGDALLEKPVDGHELVRTVCALLGTDVGNDRPSDET